MISACHGMSRRFDTIVPVTQPNRNRLPLSSCLRFLFPAPRLTSILLSTNRDRYRRAGSGGRGVHE